MSYANLPKLIPVAKAAEVLPFSARTLTRYIDLGLVEGRRLGLAGYYYVPQTELERLLTKGMPLAPIETGCGVRYYKVEEDSTG